MPGKTIQKEYPKLIGKTWLGFSKSAFKSCREDETVKQPAHQSHLLRQEKVPLGRGKQMLDEREARFYSSSHYSALLSGEWRRKPGQVSYALQYSLTQNFHHHWFSPLG